MQKYKRNNNFVSFNRIAREEQRHRIEWAEKKKKIRKVKIDFYGNRTKRNNIKNRKQRTKHRKFVMLYICVMLFHGL